MNEFNTDMDEELETTTSKKDDDFASMFSESLKGAEKKLRVGDKISGKILNHR